MLFAAVLILPLLAQAEPRREKQPPPGSTVSFVVNLVDRKRDARPARDGTATIESSARGSEPARLTAPIRKGRFEFTLPDDRKWSLTRLDFEDAHVRFDRVRFDRSAASAPLEVRATLVEPIVLHVVAAETGAELNGVELVSASVPFLRARPLAAGRVRDADGVTGGRLRSPVTLQVDDEEASLGEETIHVKAAGRISATANLDWAGAAEVRVELWRSAGFTVRVENFEMPGVARPEGLSEEIFQRTVRPHVAVREFVENKGFGSLGFGSEKEIERLARELRRTAPDSIREAARADCLAAWRFSLIASRSSRHDPALPFPINSDGLARVDEMKPGRYLITLDVHQPFHDEIDNVVHRFEWMSGEGRPLAAVLFDFDGADGREVVLRAPPKASSARGSARVRLLDAVTGLPAPISEERFRAGILGSAPAQGREGAVDDREALRVTARRDGDGYVLEGPAGFASMSIVDLEPPWYAPVRTFVELRAPGDSDAAAAATIDLTLARACGVAVHWRDPQGPLDAKSLSMLAFRDLIELLDGEGRGCEAFHDAAVSLFLVPGGGRCSLCVTPKSIGRGKPSLDRIEGGTLTEEGAAIEVAAGRLHEVTATLKFE